MTGPLQSPDLNPIKMVCDEVDLRDKARGPASAHHLWGLFQDHLVNHFSFHEARRDTSKSMQRVIQAKHGYFEEPKI